MPTLTFFLCPVCGQTAIRQDGLLHMETILGLIQHDGVIPVRARRGNFLAAVRG